MSLRLNRSLNILLFLICLLVPASAFCQENAPRSTGGLYPEEVISAEDLKKKMDSHEDLLLLDARNKQSFDSGHIDGAQLPRSEDYYRQEELFRTGTAPQSPDPDKALVEWTGPFPKDRLIVTYCNSDCHASAVLALRLKQLGFAHVLSMEEGFQSWEKKGFPIQPKKVIVKA